MATQHDAPLYLPSTTFWTTKFEFVVPFFFFLFTPRLRSLVKRQTMRLHPQRANPTSTLAFFPRLRLRRPAERPAAEPELQRHLPVYDPHPEQREQPDSEREKWKGGGGTEAAGTIAVGNGCIAVVVEGGGTQVLRGGSAVLRVTVTIEMQALSMRM